MTIVVEDGSRPVGANSYVTLQQARDYASARDVTLSATDSELEAQLLKAMDFLESFSDRFKGYQVVRDQPLSWPRTNVYIENWYWGDGEIPRQVINAQLALILEIHAGEDPFNPSIATLPTVRERVEGAVEVEYANPGQALKVGKTQPSMTHIRLLLRNSGMFAIRA